MEPLQILKNNTDKKTGIFIDDANLFYIQKEIGWQLDWKKVKGFLAKYLKLKIVRYYLGMPSREKPRLENARVKARLEKIGFTVVTKPLKKIYLDSQRQKFKHKCNFDVEIAFDIARDIHKLDFVIIVSGDSDFLDAKNFCLEKGKSFAIMCFEQRVAWEIRRIHHLFFEDIKKFVIKDKNKPR